MDEYLTSKFWEAESPVIFQNTRKPAFDDDLEEFVSQEPLLAGHILFATSGSSGEAKWVALGKSALLSSARTVCDYFQITSDDCLGLVLPSFHVGGFGLIARAYYSGADLLWKQGDWNAAAVVNWLEGGKVTLSSMVPAQLSDICDLELTAPDSLRALVIGGGHVSELLLVRARKLGWPVYLSYGQTEAASQLATGTSRWMDLLNGVEVRVAEAGTLEWRSEAAFSGYLRYKNGLWEYEPRSPNSWVGTSDVVELESRKLHFVRRADRVVKVLGELVDISLLEIELSADQGCEVKVVCLPDQRQGMLLIPVMEGAQGSRPDVIERMGLERLQEVVFVDHFPRTPLGKICLKTLQTMV